MGQVYLTDSLTHPQQRIMSMEQLFPGTALWNNAGTLTVQGPLSLPLLERAVFFVLQHTETLHLQMHRQQQEVVQRVVPMLPKALPVRTFTGPEALRAFEKRHAEASMALYDAPLYELVLLDGGAAWSGLFLKFHHVISDAHSLVGFCDEVMRVYQAFANGDGAPQPGLAAYTAYRDRETAYIGSRRYERDKAYWAAQLSELPEQAFLYSRPPETLSAARIERTLPAPVQKEAADWVARKGVSLFVLFLALYAAYQCRLTGQTRQILAAPVDNRSRGMQDVFGMCISTVPLVVDCQPEDSFAGLVEKVQTAWLGALKHCNYPFDVLMHDVRQAHPGLTNLYECMISYQHQTFARPAGLQYHGTWHFAGAQAHPLTLHISHREGDGRVTLTYDYQTARYEESAVRALHARLMTALACALRDPDAAIDRLEILPAEEQARVLQNGRGAAPFCDKETILSLWRTRVDTAPDAACLNDHGTVITAAALDRRGDRAAAWLQARGVGKGDVVALLADNTYAYVSCVLGVLKTGAALLPLHPDTPPKRLAFMLRDSGAALLWTDQPVSGKEALDCPVYDMQALPLQTAARPVDVGPQDAAYVIYTSGSTGKPKGVRIDQGAMARFIGSMQALWTYDQGARMLCAGSHGFDLSLMELLPCLCRGGCCVLADRRRADDPDALAALMMEQRVNTVMMTPGRMELLLAARQSQACLKQLRAIGLGGEALPQTLLRTLQRMSPARLYNFYGPTEATISATCADLTKQDAPHIGRPMPGVRAYVLDAQQRLAPIGEPGELYIGGMNLAHGYVGWAQANSDAFLPDPFVAGARCYRTGDRVAWLQDGTLDYLGRGDRQVKVRGFRIELGEIENALLRAPGVTGCTVQKRADEQGHETLCAYLCGVTAGDLPAIKAHVLETLPRYMLPAQFVCLERLPVNRSGKVDVRALPEPEDQPAEAFEAPATPTERTLAALWAEVLPQHNAGRTDDFFALGGDSLSVVRLLVKIRETFGVTLDLQALYRDATLSAMADRIARCAPRPAEQTIEQEADRWPATAAQRRMWVLHAQDPRSVAYHIPVLLALDGPVEEKTLQRALDALVNRHASLRAGFVMRGDTLLMRRAGRGKVPLVSLACTRRDQDRVLRDLMQPFDLTKPPLMRAALIDCQGQTLLFLQFHHSIADGRSIELLLEELGALYKGQRLAPVRQGYQAYAAWERAALSRTDGPLAQDRTYWKQALEGPLPLLNLHTDLPRPHKARHTGARLAFALPDADGQALAAYCKKQKVTPYHVLLSVYAALLYRYTGGQEDLIIGTPAAGRRLEEQDVCGLFVNTLPLRLNPQGAMPFETLVQQAAHTAIQAQAHQLLPLDEMLALCGAERDASRNPLFDTMLVYNAAPPCLQLGSVKGQMALFDPKVAKVDLTLETFVQNGRFSFVFEYDTALFRKRTIQRMARHFTRLCALFLSAPETTLSGAAMLEPEETGQLVTGFNRTDAPLPACGGTVGLWRQAAEAFAHKTALRFEGRSMTFAEIERRSEKLAYALKEKGVRPGQLVALHVKRGFEMICALVAVWKTGAGYLPLDPTYPKDRLAFMLRDSGAALLAADGPTALPFDGPVLRLDELPDAMPADAGTVFDALSLPAYVIYTSGSTGTPKGCTLSRRAMVNLYEGTKEVVRFAPEEISVSVTTFSFDIFVMDAIMPLLFGCTVCLCNEEELRQPGLLAALIARERVSYLQTTPTRMRLLMEDPAFVQAAKQHIQKIVLGGEEFPLSLLKCLKRRTHARIISGYGPTETTVYCSFKDLTHTDHITIGRPMANTRIYVLDGQGQIAPMGVLGEAYISGFCVGDGYIGREELNREKFLPDPFWPGHTMYRSGDLCAWQPDGELAIRGRADHQVKLRGLRIELGEIEAALRKLPEVQEAVVCAVGQGLERYLCAYYAAPHALDPAQLRSALAKQLPQYMVPQGFVPLARMPLTVNGKIDRKALPAPQRGTESDEQTRALTPTEKKMAKLWKRILGAEQVHPQDSFFALGGDSLRVIQTQAAASRYGWALRTQDFYDRQTLEALCALIDRTAPKERAKRPRYAAHPPHNRTAQPAAMQRVLLTGATGFLGAHVLWACCRETPDCRVYALVRGRDKTEAEAALSRVLVYYFGEQETRRLMTRVCVVCGDITRPRLGLTPGALNALAEDIDTVVHCAAITDHIGYAERFEQVNVAGTRRVAAFSLRAEAMMVHVSTVSVAGQAPLDKPFAETDLDLGQRVQDNPYAYSKFKAERVVYAAMAKGLRARVARVGVLTGRQRDGKFQLRPEKNAFANRLLALMRLGCAPLASKDQRVDMTPVDQCAEALVAVAARVQSEQAVYHLCHPAPVTMETLAGWLETPRTPMRFVDQRQWQAAVRKGMDRHSAAGLVMDEAPGPEMDQKATQKALSAAGFVWLPVDRAYTERFIRALRGVKGEGRK